MAADHDVAFPVLSDQELSALKIRGQLRSVHAGEILYQEGDRTQNFFVVLDGAVEVVGSSQGTPRQITVHRRGNFTGDVSLLSGRAVLVTGRVIEDGTVVQLDPVDLRHAVDELPELGDIIIKAFMKRRQLIVEDGFAGVQIIGSRFSPDAHRLRDFASRNAIPARFRDLETDPEAESLLQSLGVIEDGTVVQLDPDDLRHAVDELPELGDIIIKAFMKRRQLIVEDGFAGVQIIGSRFSPDAHRLRDFASRNAIPARFRDLETDPEAESLLQSLGVSPAETPIVIGREGQFHRNPTLEQFGACAGLTATLEPEHLYDLVVVGAGPAGLAASVYAASEGLDVLTIDAMGAGGQAGTSMRIENYLGFPSGISGAELTGNALIQAQRFGARITVPVTVRSLGLDGGDRVITLTDGSRVKTRCVLVASGVQYRRLDVPRFKDFEAAGIYYAASEMEAKLCRGEEVVVVGAGNSAGQAIAYLATGDRASHVHLVMRGNDLGKSMSRYLVDRVERMDKVTIHRNAKVTGLQGDGHLSGVEIEEQGRRQAIPTNALFLFIGADPKTEWLRNCVDLDKKGFVMTGINLPHETSGNERWRAEGRAPFLLETSLPGIFAAGDVRSGSTKRVSAAVGEGSMAVSFVHAHIGRAV